MFKKISLSIIVVLVLFLGAILAYTRFISAPYFYRELPAQGNYYSYNSSATKSQEIIVNDEEVIRNLTIKEQLDPINTSSISIYPFDFNHDGDNEYIVYFQKKLSTPTVFWGENIDWNGAFVVYQKINKEWVVVFKDEGTLGKKGYDPITKTMVYPFSMLAKDTFLTFVDIDEDGVKEAQITTFQDGTGGYTDTYFLVWDGTKITKAIITESKITEELSSS